MLLEQCLPCERDVNEPVEHGRERTRWLGDGDTNVEMLKEAWGKATRYLSGVQYAKGDTTG